MDKGNCVENQYKACVKDEKVYNYSEAIDLAGNGRYTISLLVILSLAFLAMCVDLLSFSIIVSFSSCEFQLDLAKKSFLVSIPFIGSVFMAYPWGYIADTGGRKMTLLLSLSVSFIMSSLGAFAPNWIVLGVFKLVGSCFCTAVQSAAFTLFGESCSDRVKGTYLIIMSSVIHITGAIYFVLAYYIGNMGFSYDLGFISFVPWRLLVLVLALPLGICAIFLKCFFYESPKFLINAGREDEALDTLKHIYRRNGGKMENYLTTEQVPPSLPSSLPSSFILPATPDLVQKVVLNEDGNISCKDTPFLESLWMQTAPLFKPPLLLNTLLLYCLIFSVYISNSGLYVWLPFLAKAFTTNPALDESNEDGLCSMISKSHSNSTSQSVSCNTSIDATVVIAFTAYGAFATVLNILLCKMASRKRTLMSTIMLISGLSCIGTAAIPHYLASYLYFVVLLSGVCVGLIFSYFVDLYPTSFRGMASCLGVMFARISGIAGINLMGPFIVSHCSITFYCCSALIFGGLAISFLLPADRPKNPVQKSVE